MNPIEKQIRELLVKTATSSPQSGELWEALDRSVDEISRLQEFSDEMKRVYPIIYNSVKSRMKL